MKDLKQLYNYKEYEIKISRIPIVNGHPLRSKCEVVEFIRSLVEPIWKPDPFIRPYPPIMINYHDVEMRALVRFLQRILTQLCNGFVPTPDHNLTNYGFALRVPHTDISDYIYVHVVLSADNYKCERFIPLCQCQAVIDNFLNTKVLMKNKSVTIS